MNLVESIQNAQFNVQDAERELARSQSERDLVQQLYAVGSESRENVQLAQDSYNRALDSLSKARLALSTLQESQELRASANQQDLYNTELSVQASRLGLERAQEELAATSLRAAFAGVIAEVTANLGDSATSSGIVLTLIDDTRVQLEAQIDETEISLISLGLSAEVTLDAVGDQAFLGTVTTISPVARIVSNIPIFDVTITLDNTQGLMRPGMTAEARGAFTG
jgi:HlyD family secretion protein